MEITTFTLVAKDPPVMGLQTEPSTLVVNNLSNGEELLRISKSDFIYKGEKILDAGRAHQAFIEAFDQLRPDIKEVRTQAYEAIGLAIHILNQRVDDQDALVRDSRYIALCKHYATLRSML